MLFLIVAGTLLVPHQTPPADRPLVASFVVTDKKGHPVEDLKVEEVVVSENGASRPIEQFELDRRPLTVALVVDSSGVMGSSFRSDVVPAVVGFLKKLPAESRFAVWTTTDRPKLLVPESTDVAAAETSLQGVPALGNNAAVETIVEASQQLARLEGRRTAVVVVTSATMGDISADVQALVPKISFRPSFLVAELITGQQDPRLQDTLKLVTARTAGFHERLYSTMAVPTQLGRMLEHLAGQYRVAYRPAGDPRSAKLEIKVTRKDTRSKTAQRLTTAW